MREGWCIAVFASTHDAIAAERGLAGRLPGMDILPTPRAISAACGISLRFPESAARAAQELLTGLLPHGSFLIYEQREGAWTPRL